MIIPEINPQHIEIIPAQRERLGTKRGFIAVKSNCSLQSYLPAMAVVNMKYPIDHALVTTYQAISGAGKTFKTWPEMVDNLIPYIGGEEMKSEVEPNKVLGKIEGKEIVPSTELQIECQTYRVPVSNGQHSRYILLIQRQCKQAVCRRNRKNVGRIQRCSSGT